MTSSGLPGEAVVATNVVSGFQGRQGQWLDQMGVETSLCRLTPVVHLAPPSQSDNKEAFAPNLLPQTAGYVVAVQLRQSNIKEHHVHNLSADEL